MNRFKRLPRIYFDTYLQQWYCAGAKDGFICNGRGNSPTEAFNKWKADKGTHRV